jgi:hypothetical protein
MKVTGKKKPKIVRTEPGGITTSKSVGLTEENIQKINK